METELSALSLQSKSTKERGLVVQIKRGNTAPVISCHNCGKLMKSVNGLTMCDECFSTNVDLTKDLPKQGDLTFCKECGRLLIPPSNWVYCERESKELLEILLKRIKRYENGLRFIDARFIWTEPHSRRTKLEVTVQGEPEHFNNLVIQQSYVFEYYEHTNMCSDCMKSYTAHTWQTKIQIRQRVEHKKTFLLLEQLILKKHAHHNTLSIAEKPNGLDFHYASRDEAERMVSFIEQYVPVRVKRSGQLVSHDVHTNDSKFKFTIFVEIAAICCGDLVVLPKSVARAKNISQLVLCVRVSASLYFIDPNTLDMAVVYAHEYFKHNFKSILTTRKLTKFTILDVEPTGPTIGRYSLADVTVMRSDDLATGGNSFLIRTHIGNDIEAGDECLGYDLTTVNFNDDNLGAIDESRIPDIVLVRKAYQHEGETIKLHLRRMAIEYNDYDESGKSSKQKIPGHYGDDFDEVILELANDPELQKIYMPVSNDEIGRANQELGVDHI